MDKTISVIVPIYNAEKYLKRCVDSILRQTYENFEIVLVDDGSTDNSSVICSEYEKTDKRIKLIRRENGGLSAARNTGIDNSDSKFIMFADADDEMMPEMAERLMDLLLKYDADIAECEFKEIEGGKQKNVCEDGEKISVYSGSDILSMLYKNRVETIVQWNKLYKREIFESIRYPEGRVHEDEWVIHRELAAAKKLVHTNEQLYVYYRHKDTITARPTLQKGLDAAEGFADRVAFLREIGRDDLARQSYNIFTWYCGHLRYRLREFPDAVENYGKLLDIKRKAKREFREYEKRLPLTNRMGRALSVIRSLGMRFK